MLYNDYVYFWRWALWKLFEHQHNSGIVSFITAVILSCPGPGFVGIREVMRRTFDELWIINLEGDNLGARKTENVFAIQTPVAIAIGIRLADSNLNKPALVHYTKITGLRKEKLTALNDVRDFSNIEWQECSSGWQDRFLPTGHGDFFAWPSLIDIFPWQHPGVQFSRNWPIGETTDLLNERWINLTLSSLENRQKIFKESRDRKINKVYKNCLPGSGLITLDELSQHNVCPNLLPYAFRSFDRSWAIFDTRLGDYLRPDLFQTLSNHQIFLVTAMTEQLGLGSSAMVSSQIPDLNFFNGRGGSAVFHFIKIGNQS